MRAPRREMYRAESLRVYEYRLCRKKNAVKMAGQQEKKIKLELISNNNYKRVFSSYFCAAIMITIIHSGAYETITNANCRYLYRVDRIRELILKYSACVCLTAVKIGSFPKYNYYNIRPVSPL